MAEVSFTERELEIMGILWERESGTVAEVRDALPHGPAHTTVLTLMRILEGKGHVRREVEGKGHRYFPTVGRRQAGRSAVRRMLGTVFRGEPELLMTALLQEEQLSEEQLRRLRAMVDERLGDEPEGTGGGKRRRP